MRKRWLIIMLGFLLFPGHKFIAAQNPFFQHYTTFHGLPSNSVYQVFQDSKNFIWFATDAGAARYDGSRFSYFSNRNGLNSNEIIRIDEDSQGRIWFFNLNGTFNYLYQNTIFNASNAPFLDSLSNRFYFRRFYEDKNKTVYLFDNLAREVYTLDSNNLVAKYKFPDNRRYRADKNSYENIYKTYAIRAQSDGSLMHFMTGGIFTSKQLGDSLQLVDNSFFIDRVFETNDSVLFLEATGRKDWKPYILKSRNLKPTDTLNFENRLKDEFITHVFQDEAGRHWISSYYTGIYCYEHGKLVHHFNIPKAQNLIQDHQGNIWFCSLGNGVYKLNPFFLKSRHYESSLFDGKGLVGITRHHGGGIWATNGRRLFLVKDMQVFPSVYRHGSDGIDKIAELQNKTLLLNEANYYLKALNGLSVNGGMVTHTNLSSHYELSKWFSLSPNADKIASFYPYRLFKVQQDSLFGGMESKHIESERVYNTWFNHKDELFVNGLQIYTYNKGQMIPYTPLNRIKGKIVRQHLNLDYGAELYNIGGDSLFLLYGDELHDLTLAFDQPIVQSVRHMAYDSPLLFLATASHLYFCEFPLKATKGHLVSLYSVDMYFNNIHELLAHNNQLFVASDDGLTQLQISNLQNMQAKMPSPYFHKVMTNDKDVLSANGKIDLRGPNRLQFVFGSIDYTSGGQAYAYLLEGVGSNWVEGLGDNVVLQNLPPGVYTLRLKVKKPTTGWSSEVSYYIRIRPAFYQHHGFYIVIALLLIGFFYFVLVRNRNKKIRKIEAEHQMVLLEQKALQSMMNPHFIFNALGSIQNYILKNKPQDAGLYLSQFARLIRQNLNAIQSTTIPLDEEVDRLRNYLELERMRMNNRFGFVIDIADDIEEDALIPTMIIQPIVENAVWHGLAALDTGGMVTIRFIKNNANCIKVVVEDNGIGIEKARAMTLKKESHLKIGMQLTQKRLELFSKDAGKTANLVYEEASPGRENPGTRVTIILPYVGEG